MTAALAAQLEIGADALNLPQTAAAGVILFHRKDIAYLNVHWHVISLL